MASKYLAASILDSLLLRFCMGWSSVLLKGVLSTQVAPTPEGRWKVFTSCWGLASGDSLMLQERSKRFGSHHLGHLLMGSQGLGTYHGLNRHG